MKIGGVDDPIPVPLLGEEALAVLGKVGVYGVARDDGVEVRGAAIGLWAQYATESLCFFLPGAEGAGDLDSHCCFR